MKLIPLIFLLLGSAALVAENDVVSKADSLFASRDNDKDLQNAVSILQEEQLRDPSDYEVLWRIAKFSYSLSDRTNDKKEQERLLHQGIDAAKKAIAIDSKRVEAHFWLAANLGTYSEMKGIWKSLSSLHSIRSEFETAMKIDPVYDNGAVYLALGEMDLRVPGFLGGDDQKGLRMLEEGYRKAPSNADLKLTLAAVYVKKGRKDDGKRLLQSVLDTEDPSLSPNEYQNARKKAQTSLQESK